MTGAKYSIKDLENMTQIKAHTIRIWEQRYKLLSPKRTETNIRYYDEADLKKILNINLLYTAGNKISKIASLTESEIGEKAKSLIVDKVYEQQSEIDKMILHILNYNGDDIKRLLESGLKKKTLDELYKDMILPLLQKIGQLWQVNSFSIIQEHYFSNIIRDFFVAKIDQLKTPHTAEKKALLFLHDREEHEFSLLLYYYMLKKHGFRCYYFGQKTPMIEIGDAYNQIKPRVVVTTFTTRISDHGFEKIETKLLGFAKQSKIIISGSQLNNFEKRPSAKLTLIESIDDFKKMLKSL